MTPRDLERAREIVREYTTDSWPSHGVLVEAIAAAIADEREANAKVCESKLCEFGVIVPGSVPPRRIAPGEMDWNVALTEAASAIRARGGA